jgi:hypothetical protein
MYEELEARPGEDITPRKWNALKAAVAELRLRAGYNVRLRRVTGVATTISFDDTSGPFVGRFAVTLLPGQGAKISQGFVNASIEPTINGVPISGDSANNVPQPVLQFSTPKVGADGRGWIALLLTATSKLTIGTIEAVQVASLDAKAIPGSGGPVTNGGSPAIPGNQALHPLAMLIKRSSGAVDLFQIEFFNLQWRLAYRPGAGAARHFFYAS